MTTASPVMQIVNQATQYFLSLTPTADTTKWYRGLRHQFDNVSPPRVVWGPTQDAFDGGVHRLQPGQTFSNPENRWFAKERIELHCWGRDLDDAWRLKAQVLKAFTAAMANSQGSWRAVSGTYIYTEKSKNVDRGEDYRLVLEFDIPQDQGMLAEITLTPINITGEMDFGDGRVETPVFTVRDDYAPTGFTAKLGSVFSRLGRVVTGNTNNP